MQLKQLIKIVIGWRIILTLVGLIAGLLITFRPSYPYAKEILAPLGPQPFSSWGAFDGVHYLTIMEKGYKGTGSIQAFFPLYPLVVKVVSVVLPHLLLASILVSTGCLIGALYLLHKLIMIDETRLVANEVIALMLVFPTAFFFTAVYAESLFLLLVVAAFYAARKKAWLISGIFAALASATKITGILLVPALLVEYWQQAPSKDSFLDKVKHNGAILMGTTGLVAYMAYLKSVFSDALLFLHVQASFGAGRQTDSLVLIYQVFYRYIKMILTVNPMSLTYYTVIFEFVTAIGFLVILVWAFWQTRTSYALFGLASFILPSLTGTFTSLPRYVLVLFPAFMVLGKKISPQKAPVVKIIFGILLAINTILFIQGYWVA